MPHEKSHSNLHKRNKLKVELFSLGITRNFHQASSNTHLLLDEAKKELDSLFRSCSMISRKLDDSGLKSKTSGKTNTR
jgi:hypothetical protein